MVVGRSQSKKKNFIVNSQIEFDNGRQPIAVDWWLYREKDGSFSLFDVRVIGVWMAQEQRDSFASVLKNNRGDISALLSHIRKQIKPAAQSLTVKLLVFYTLGNFGIGPDGVCDLPHNRRNCPQTTQHGYRLQKPEYAWQCGRETSDRGL